MQVNIGRHKTLLNNFQRQCDDRCKGPTPESTCLSCLSCLFPNKVFKLIGFSSNLKSGSHQTSNQASSNIKSKANNPEHYDYHVHRAVDATPNAHTEHSDYHVYHSPLKLHPATGFLKPIWFPNKRQSQPVPLKRPAFTPRMPRMNQA